MTPGEQWLRTGSHSRCPECGSYDDLRVCQVIRLTPPGGWSLAGAQVKYPATGGWCYKCFRCGAEGDCEIRTSTRKELAMILEKTRQRLQVLRADPHSETMDLYAASVMSEVLHALAGMPQLSGEETAELAELGAEAAELGGWTP